MPTSANAPSVEVIDTLELNPEARARLRAEMLAVEERAYVPSPHLSAEEMRALEVEYLAKITDPEIFSRYQQTTVFRVEGQPVAFYHACVQSIDVEGQEVEVIRNTTATLPGHRAGGLVAKAALRTAAHYAKRHLFARTPRYYAGRAASPISYEMVGRRALHLYPSPSPRNGSEMRRVFRAIHGNDDWLERESVATFESRNTHAQFAATKSPFGRFFLKVNPRYAEGHSLRVLVRVHGPDLAYALATSAALAAVRPLRRLQRR